MATYVRFIEKRSAVFILLLIIIIGVFLRTYLITERFEFGHDGDLYSWIVKDIVVNGHPRLIGQLTSADGIFIGPFFYYLLIPFFLLANMDPAGVTLLGVIIGIVTIVSYYFVFSKLFSKTAGLIAAFLHAASLGATGFDRWIVPTLPVKLWAVWYLYCLVTISRKNYSSLPLLGILIGLIWHIHIALYPALIAIPVAFYFSRKLPSIKQIIYFFLALAVTSLPLILFEMRHNFMQTLSFFNNLTSSRAGEIGLLKLVRILNMLGVNTDLLLFFANPLDPPLRLLILPVVLFSAFLLIKKRLLKLKEVITIYAWFFAVILFFSASSTPISEYYFANLEIITVLLISLLITFIIKSSKFGRYFILMLLGIFLIKNISFYISYKPYELGYKQRKEAANYIFSDAKLKGFPCIGITYITRPGENVGFRYFFYMKNQTIAHPSSDVPVYNIVIPYNYSSEVEQKFGYIGIIPPTKIPPLENIQKNCRENTNLTDSLFGYVE